MSKSNTLRLLSVLKTTAVVALVVGLAACAKKPGQSSNGSQEDGMCSEDSMRFYGTNLSPEQEQALLNRNVYYFGYDQYDMSDDDRMSLNAHAKKIMSGGQKHVRIEGHTDDRGSREYNVALGERRAKALKNGLMLKGVNTDQINVVSYGKEKPAAFGQDEAAWSQNRRGMIVYEGE